MRNGKLLMMVAVAALFVTGVVAQSTQKMRVEKEKLYGDTFNPRQKEYANHVGFNDLHIQAIRHIMPEGDNSRLNVIVHHHCKGYDDGTFTCLMFPTGMKDQDKPHGFEYIIPTDQYNTLPAKEKRYWHYHKTEIPRAKAELPDLTDEELQALLPALNETYGKVIYTWKLGDEFPIGEPSVLIVQDLPDL